MRINLSPINLLNQKILGYKSFEKSNRSFINCNNNRAAANAKALDQKMTTPTNPLSYHFVLRTIKDALPNDAIIVNEGANTMDMFVFFKIILIPC